MNPTHEPTRNNTTGPIQPHNTTPEAQPQAQSSSPAAQSQQQPPISTNSNKTSTSSAPATVSIPPYIATSRPPAEAQLTSSNAQQSSLNEPSAQLMQAAASNDRKRAIANSIRSFLSFAIFVATVVVAATLINQFIFQSYYVDGSSMTPTLHNDDRLIIDKTGKTLAAIEGKPYVPARGSIVVLDSSIVDQYGHQEQLIKRVIGLPGEVIHIEDGVVTIKNKTYPNGFDVDKSLGLNLTPTYSASTLDITIPNNSVFVMGDNRGINGSYDSRAFGPVLLNKIEGRLALRVFPFNQIRSF